MTGMCQDDPCQGVQCPPLQVCDPAQAACIPDPCQGITCPGGQICNLGQCGVGTSGELVTTGGGGGCNSSGGEGALGLVLVIGAFVLRRRRAAVLAVAIAAAVPACDVNEYCLACAIAPEALEFKTKLAKKAAAKKANDLVDLTRPPKKLSKR